MPAEYERIVHIAAWGIELVGVAVIVIGGTLATAHYLLRSMRSRSLEDGYREVRAGLGRAILLGLEFLVAGDIIATILIEPTLASVGSLGLIVLIRTFLSFSLETEIEGRPPWKREERAEGVS